jgi:hypothetical protein
MGAIPSQSAIAVRASFRQRVLRLGQAPLRPHGRSRARGENHHLADEQGVRATAQRHGLVEPAFHLHGGVGDARRAHMVAGQQADAQVLGCADLGRKVMCRQVQGFQLGLGRHVDHELAPGEDVARRVLELAARPLTTRS